MYDLEKCKAFLEHIGLDPRPASQPPDHPIWHKARFRLSQRLIDEADLLLRLDRSLLRRLGCEMPKKLFGSDDLHLLHEALKRIAQDAGVDFSVPHCRYWDAAALANAMRIGGANHRSIDLDVTSRADFKVFMLYRKLGFKSVEDCVAQIGPRRAFALVQLVSNLSSPQVPVPLFSTSAETWVNRVKRQMQTHPHPLSQEGEPDVQYIGLDLRNRMDKTTWVTNEVRVPALLEAITANPGMSYSMYFQETHTLIIGPAPETTGWLFWRRNMLSAPLCVFEIVLACHRARNNGGSPSLPQALTEANLRDLDNWLRDKIQREGSTTLSLLADAIGTPAMPSLP